ncbi:hypothetical protein, partial [uncultured Eudoraea sp.]|uniref:hypothetical protein n=1 Tax=uncultured Eudoraea sp. TaxID=1035614 RepID=UPI0026399B6D
RLYNYENPNPNPRFYPLNLKIIQISLPKTITGPKQKNAVRQYVNELLIAYPKSFFTKSIICLS